MLQAFANWRWDELYGNKFHDGKFKSWSGTRSRAHPYGHRDGVDIVVAETDFNPDDDFLKLEEFFASAPSQPPGESPGEGDHD